MNVVVLSKTHTTMHRVHRFTAIITAAILQEGIRVIVPPAIREMGLLRLYLLITLVPLV
jgi:hypothetical protein